MWLFTHDRSKPWEENQHSIYTFNSVEEFWGLYHNIALPSELPSGCDYSLFKDGIKPMWEDKKNKDGGRWVLQAGKKNMIGSPGNEQPALDIYWLEVKKAITEATHAFCGNKRRFLWDLFSGVSF